MNAVLDRIAVVLGTVATGILWIAGAGLVTMTAVVGWQVFGRYVLNDTPNWSEQFSTFLMVYYILLAAAVGVREQIHIGLVFLRDSLPRRGRLALDILINLLIAGFGAVLAWYGAESVVGRWNQTIPTLGLPTGTGYLPFPIAGVLIVMFALENVLKALAGREVKRAWN